MPYDFAADFEAEITILSKRQCRRQTAPHNGIRWDFKYADDESETSAFMIWPEFLTDNYEPVSGALCFGSTYRARMYVVVDELRDYHRRRITVGTMFFCVEGPHEVANGTVTKIINL